MGEQASAAVLGGLDERSLECKTCRGAVQRRGLGHRVIRIIRVIKKGLARPDDDEMRGGSDDAMSMMQR